MYDRYTSDISAVHQAAALLHSLVRAEVEAGVERRELVLGRGLWRNRTSNRKKSCGMH